MTDGNKGASPSRPQHPARVAIELERYMLGKGMTVRDLAEFLEIPYPTLTAGLRGDRAFPSDARIRRKIADLLGVSGLQVAVWCEILSIEDFSVPPGKSDLELRALRGMKEDPAVGYLIPEEEVWKTWPPAARAAIILIYQELTKNILLPPVKVPAPKVASEANEPPASQ